MPKNIQECISSQQTVSSEIQERAIDLGKSIVQELRLEPGVDTLSRWIAHYIAEQIAIAESEIGDKKDKAEERCFKSILKLWDHRASYPNDKYPFKDFERIFEVLDRINHENKQSYYFNNPFIGANSNTHSYSEVHTDEVNGWLNIAIRIDSAARNLIHWSLKNATRIAADDKSIAWIHDSTGISTEEKNDISVILHIISGNTQDVSSDEKSEEIVRQKLTSRINQLDMMLELCSILKEELSEELQDI